MMLDHLGEHDAAAAILHSIEAILSRGRSFLTLDLGGTATTEQLGTAISNQISRR
jgi:tartrate dehydrogenase/decarboxylase/D-malate dehydrogenase